MSIRLRLLLVVIGVWLPTAAGFGLLTWNMHEETTAATRRQVEEYALRVGTTIERELDQRATLARTLAATHAAQEGDFARFHQEARAATAGLNAWVLVVDPAMQLLNTRAPYTGNRVRRAKPLPLTEGPPDIVFVPHAPVAQRPAITVFVPVPGRTPQAYNVGVSFEPATSLQRSLDANPGPFKALTAVVNQDQVIMARSRDPERWFGQSASPSFRKRIVAGGVGFAESTTLDGVRSMTYLSPPSTYGWSVIVSVPLSEINAAAQQASAKAVGAAALLLGFGLLIALLGTRKISRTVDALQRSADELGRNRVPAPITTGVAEVDQVGAALHEAGLQAQRSNEVLERRVREAVEEAKAVQTKLLQSQKLELVGRLTAGVAHDFNNVLQTIVSSHYVLARRITDGLEKRSLDSAVRAASKARDLVQQLMAFGRVQTLAPTAVNIADMVIKGQELTRTAVPESIALSTVIEASLPAVHVDAVQFEMALLNLVFNARDALPAGGTIAITAREAAYAETAHLGPGRFVRVEVADDGTGMSEEVRLRAFEPYFTTKPVGSGSGIGLAQVHAFARQSGGDIVLTSRLGAGTQVCLYLPVADAPGEPEPAALPASAAPPRAALRILLVEDDALVSSATVSTLEEEGFCVRHCSNADEALQWLRGGEPLDLLFTDVVMPGTMNGIDLAKWCAAERPGLAVVVSTGYAEHLDEVAATVLRKPYETSALLDALASAWQQKQRP